MNRRGFLVSLGLGVTLVALYERGASDRPGHSTTPTTTPPASHPAAPAAFVQRGTPDLARAVPDRVLWGLPAIGNYVALTIDDGVNTDVLGAYLAFVQRTGIRITFFPNGVYASWTDHAPTLRPLVESGQVQLGNHTWNHPDLRTLSDAAVADQLARNAQFLRNTYGTTGQPFYRPPYGSRDARVDRLAADQGYWVSTMWNGSFGDSAQLTPSQVVANASQWLTAQRIVIGHANYPAVTHVYDQLTDLIQSRKLMTVTLNDVFNTT